MSKKISKKMKELENIVSDLDGELELEDALDTFEKGIALARDIKKQLAAAENQIEKLTAKGRKLTDMSEDKEKENR